MDARPLFKTAVGWFFAALFAMLGLTAAIGSGSWAAFLVAVLLVIVTAPLSRALLADKARIKLQGSMLLLTCFGLFVGMMLLAVNSGEEQEKRRVANDQRIAQERAEQAKQAVIAEFKAGKVAILAAAKEKSDARKFDEALSSLQKYSALLNDADLDGVRMSILVAKDKAAIPGAGEMTLHQRFLLYQRLSGYEPDNADYRAKMLDLQAKFQAEQAREEQRRVQLQAQAERERKFLAQFSKWDGSNHYVEREVKASMKNPDSYQHVETRYKIDGETMRVYSTYRGTNSFNAIVPGRVMAVVDADGRILTMKNID